MVTTLITGANRGIGLALARHYADAGEHVLAFCRNPGNANELQALAQRSAGRVSLHAIDIADTKAVRAAARDLGETPVDILINNAGIAGGPRQSLGSMDYDAWLHTLDVLTLGPFRVSEAFLPNLLKSKQPKLVLITSQLGASTWPRGGLYAYSSGKAALNKVGQTLAIDLKDRGVIVALLHPGYVRTDMGGPTADIAPEDSAKGIARVIASLTRADSGKFYKWNGEIHPW